MGRRSCFFFKVILVNASSFLFVLGRRTSFSLLPSGELVSIRVEVLYGETYVFSAPFFMEEVDAVVVSAFSLLSPVENGAFVVDPSRREKGLGRMRPGALFGLL